MSGKPKKPHISASSIVTYTKCGLQYMRRYINKEILPPGVAMLRGTSLHRGQELNYEQKVESKTDLPKKDVVDASVARLEDGIRAEGVLLNHEEEAIGKEKVIGKTKDLIVSMAAVLADDVMPNVQPVSVESKQLITMPADTPDLLGFIDVIDADDLIRDLKTSSKAKGQTFWDDDVQMTLYSLFYKAKMGRDPAGIVVDQLIERAKGAEYKPVTTRRGSKDYQALLNRINAVLKGIKAGVFIPANAGSWWCSPKWCGYWNSCEAVNSERTAAADASA